MSWAIWFTGLPGSGKSRLARATARALEAKGLHVTVLELDEIRKVVTPEPRYSERERELVYGGLVMIARLLVERGIPVLIDATANRRRWRDAARAAIPRFAEVYVQCPLALCRERAGARHGGHAPADIYARAGQPGATVPGVDVPYEAPVAPEVTVDTSDDDDAAHVAAVLTVVPTLDAETVTRALGASADEWEQGIARRIGALAGRLLSGR